MPSSVVDNLIKTAFEQEGMTPEEIAEDQNLNVVAVKAKLMQVSTVYRKACNNEPEDQSELNFDDEQLKAVNAVIFEAALTATHPDGSIDWKTRSSNAQYIRDDKKGRKDVKRAVASNNFNILSINERLAEASGLASKLINSSTIKV